MKLNDEIKAANKSLSNRIKNLKIHLTAMEKRGLDTSIEREMLKTLEGK